MLTIQKSVKEVTVFLIVNFLITWCIWYFARQASVSASSLAAFSPLLIRLGSAVPSALGLIFALTIGSTTEFREMLRSLIRTQIKPLWWLYTWLLFPFIIFLSFTVFHLGGGILPEAPIPVLYIPLVFLYILVLMGPLGEELGWRGFALKRMLQIWNPTLAGIMMGLIWSAWHIPLFFIQGTIQYQLAATNLFAALAGYFIYTTCISLLMTVLYINTRGNILVCIIFHAVCNTSVGTVPLILTETGATTLIVWLVLITAAIMQRYGKQPVTKQFPPQAHNTP